VRGLSTTSAARRLLLQEIIRRPLRGFVDYGLGLIDKETLDRNRAIMQRVGAKDEDRLVVEPARRAAKEAERSGRGYGGIYCGAAIELHDGTIITGKNSSLLHASSG
jgi:uncharacterized protein (UPF0371 family)